MAPLVTVIIPNYNHARYLSQRIESVLGQTYQDVEVLLLDDYSLDNSREVIDYYAQEDKRVRVIFNEKNSGSVFKQWQKGIRLAKGKYVWIAESDDFADLSFLATLVPIMEQNSLLSFAYTNSLIVNNKSEAVRPISILKKEIFNVSHWDNDYVTDGAQELANYLSLQCTVNNASAVLFRRSSIEAIGGVDTTFRYTGDWLTYIKLSLQGNIAYIARCLNNYREHESNASKASETNGQQLYERQRCFAYIYKAGALANEPRKKMLIQSSNELINLSCLLFNQKKGLTSIVRMLWGIAKASPAYWLRVHYLAVRQAQYRALRGIPLYD